MQVKFIGIFAFTGLMACMAPGANIAFGTDAGEYVNDGECDDPRFAGGAMADTLDTDNIKKDASDCEKLFAASRIRLARTIADADPAQCKAIDFGDDASKWAKDGECDDARFTGSGVDSILLRSDAKHDATDCRALCATGEIWLK